MPVRDSILAVPALSKEWMPPAVRRSMGLACARKRAGGFLGLGRKNLSPCPAEQGEDAVEEAEKNDDANGLAEVEKWIFHGEEKR